MSPFDFPETHDEEIAGIAAVNEPTTWAGRRVEEGDIRLTMPDGTELLAERLPVPAVYRDGEINYDYEISDQDGPLTQREVAACLIEALRCYEQETT